MFHPTPPAGLGPDELIRWFAGRQHDVVSRRQLVEAGLTSHQVDGRISRGVLLRIHRAVLSAGTGSSTHEGRLVAGLLAAPPGAVVSHGSAAALRGLLPVRRGPVHVTALRPARGVDGVVVHASRALGDAPSTVAGIPCTSVPRTLVDVAGSDGEVAARRAWSTLAGRRLLRPAAVEDELRRWPRRRGSTVVRGLLEGHLRLVTGRTRSDLEVAALAMCADHGLPPPGVNVLLRLDDATYEADLVWHEGRLIAELDAWTTHGHAAAFRDDRRRDFDTEIAGWSTIRLLWDDVTADAERTAARIARRLARGR